MIAYALVIIALALVFVILLAGLFALFRGGQASKTWSNRLMRTRLLAQFVAILIIGLVLYIGAG